MRAIETTFQLRDIKIAAKIWGPEEGKPILACHGWIDNAASFDALAPLLDGYRLVCIDFAGHGLSDHRPRGPLYQIADLAWDLVALLHHMGWQRCTFLGHSLGAVVGSLVAASFPEKFEHLIFIDALGPLTREASKAPQQLRQCLIKHADLHDKRAPIYKTIEDALMTRAQHSGISVEALRPMVMRGIKALPGGEYSWRTDPQLMNPMPVMMTEELALSFLNGIQTPTLFLRPEQGLEFPQEIIDARLNAVKGLTVKLMPGHHHEHMESPEIFAEAIKSFLEGNH